MSATLERIGESTTNISSTDVSVITVTAKVNPNNNSITFTFSNGNTATYDRLNAPVVQRDGTDPGQLSLEDRALQFAVEHTHLASDSIDAAGQQAYAYLTAGLATEWLAINAQSGNAATISQPALPDGSVAQPFSVVGLRSEFVHGNWYIEATAGQPGGVGSNVYDRSTGNWEVHINSSGVNGYGAQAGGIAYLIGHEIGHNTSGGLNAQSYFLTAYENDEQSHGITYGPNSYNWINNEVYANRASKTIEEYIGLIGLSQPTYGYDYH